MARKIEPPTGITAPYAFVTPTQLARYAGVSVTTAKEMLEREVSAGNYVKGDSNTYWWTVDVTVELELGD